MSKEETVIGSIHISPNAVATIAYHATLQSYGVVGLAPRNFAEGLANSITREPAKGVLVRFNENQLDIDVYVIIEYGTRVSTVSESIAKAVRFSVEKAIGIKVNSVNVHVQGLHISEE
jgi:uncharacterized alkaline shock family protein YloU